MIRIGVAGHRPEKLGGYGLNPARLAMREAFKERLLCLIGARLLETGSAAAEVFTGMALGFDQDCTYAYIQASVPFVAVVPFPAQPASGQRPREGTTARSWGQAARVIVVSELDPARRRRPRRACAWARAGAEGVLRVLDGPTLRVSRERFTLGLPRFDRPRGVRRFVDFQQAKARRFLLGLRDAG